MKTTEETRVFGAKGQEQPSWKDTNMALFGSDIETKIKAAAAEGEKQWTGPPRAMSGSPSFGKASRHDSG